MSAINTKQMDELAQELDALGLAWKRMLSRKASIWRIRFFAGLAVVTPVYMVYPQAWWLWVLLFGASALSLTTLLVAHMSMSRKISRTRHRLMLRRALEEE